MKPSLGTQNNRADAETEVKVEEEAISLYRDIIRQAVAEGVERSTDRTH
jgi:hypothetical protein